LSIRDAKRPQCDPGRVPTLVLLDETADARDFGNIWHLFELNTSGTNLEAERNWEMSYWPL